MSRKFNFKLGALCAILSAMLLMPALGQAVEEEGAHHKEQKDQIIRELKLAPAKEKAMLAVEDKYARGRQDIIAVNNLLIDYDPTNEVWVGSGQSAFFPGGSLASKLLMVNYSSSNAVDISATITGADPTGMGLVVNCDDPNNPQNLLFYYWANSSNVYWYKIVNGTWTFVGGLPVTYVSGATMRVYRAPGTQNYVLQYNGNYVWIDWVNEPTLNNNTYCGLYSSVTPSFSTARIKSATIAKSAEQLGTLAAPDWLFINGASSAITVSDGVAHVNCSTASGKALQYNFSPIYANDYYIVKLTISNYVSGGIDLDVGNSGWIINSGNGTYQLLCHSYNTGIPFIIWLHDNTVLDISNLSCKHVDIGR